MNPEQLAVQLGIVLSPAPPSVPESAAVPTPAASVTATATQPLPVAIDKLEQAFAQLLSGDRPVEALAEDLRLPVADLERLSERYRAAGRLALGLPQEPPHDGGPA